MCKSFRFCNDLHTDPGSGQPTRTIAYAYDADGRRTTATYPGGNLVSTTYTPRSQVAGISLDGAGVAGYEYNTVGHITAKRLENGTAAFYSYDAAQRLTGIQHRKGLNAFASFAYTLDSMGNRKAKTQSGLNPLAETYHYDPVDQIIEAKYGTARTVGYTYDASGNRQNVTENGTGQGYTANALNQYTNVDGFAQTYDANGNLTGTSGAAYSFDAQNRLVSATVNGVVTTFVYDPRNRVVRRTTDGTARNLTYDGWNLIEERDGSGALQQVYVHGANTDELLAKITTAGVVYYHADALGSTVALTNETGNLVESYTYDAFGTPSIRNGSGLSLPVSGFENRFLFTGRELLRDAGIYDYRNRVYSSSLGRFLQTDPIRFQAGDVNIYRYVSNNPVNWTDPLGLDRANWDINFNPTNPGPVNVSDAVDNAANYAETQRGASGNDWTHHSIATREVGRSIDQTLGIPGAGALGAVGAALAESVAEINGQTPGWQDDIRANFIGVLDYLSGHEYPFEEDVPKFGPFNIWTLYPCE